MLREVGLCVEVGVIVVPMMMVGVIMMVVGMDIRQTPVAKPGMAKKHEAHPSNQETRT
jgi:hypothetical protein